MEKLPEEFKKKWVAALRSGKYKQGQGHLEKDGQFCCLGVACRIINADTSDSEFISLNEDKIPKFLRGSHGIPWTLSEMNDGLRSGGKQTRAPMPFSEIADWIEENL